MGDVVNTMETTFVQTSPGAHVGLGSLVLVNKGFKLTPDNGCMLFISPSVCFNVRTLQRLLFIGCQ